MMAFNSGITFLVVTVLLSEHTSHVDAHAILMNPPGRSSMWRFGFKVPVNYDDNGLNCGGYGHEYSSLGGKCGVCGDPFDGKRENEAGGRYATGIIAKNYTEGQTITADIDITVYHGGWFEFRICPNNDVTKPVKQECLDRYLLKQPDGSTRFQLTHMITGDVLIPLVLPKGLTCSQCVFQWKWNTASNWGREIGHSGIGFGPQEQWYACSDIAIRPKDGTLSSATTTEHLKTSSKPTPTTTSPSTSSTTTQSTSSKSTTQRQTTHKTNTTPRHTTHLDFSTSKKTTIHSFPTTESVCKGTTEGRAIYSEVDKFCQRQCAKGNCPVVFCNEACQTVANAFLANIKTTIESIVKPIVKTTLQPVVKPTLAPIVKTTPEPIVSSTEPACKGTAAGEATYQLIDKYCQVQCAKGNCPANFCNDACQIKAKLFNEGTRGHNISTTEPRPVPTVTRTDTSSRPAVTTPEPVVTTADTTHAPIVTTTETTAGPVVTTDDTTVGPTGSNGSACKATPTGKIMYAEADMFCRVQCAKGNCPEVFCNEACQVIAKTAVNKHIGLIPEN